MAETLSIQKELSERGIATRREMVSLVANDAGARAALDMARADLTLAKANLALARADLDKAVIRSPIQGMVLNRKAEAGQIVGPGLNDPVLFVLAEDLARMELLANVDEADIGQVEVGQAAVLSVLGGVIGIALGVALAWVGSIFLAIPFAPSALVVVMAFGFSALVGVVFGCFPA